MVYRTIGGLRIHDSSIVMAATLCLSAIQFLPLVYPLDLTPFPIEHVLQHSATEIVLGFCVGFLSLIAFDLVIDLYMSHFELWISRAMYLSVFLIYTCSLLLCSNIHNIGSYYYCSTNFTSVFFTGRALADLVINDHGKEKAWTIVNAMVILISISFSIIFASLTFTTSYFLAFQTLNVFLRFVAILYFGWTSFRCLRVITNYRITSLFQVLRSKQITHEQLILVIVMAILFSTAVLVGVVPPALVGFNGIASIDTLSTCTDLIFRVVGITLLAVVPSLLLKHKAVSLQYDLDIRRNFVRYVSHEIRTPLNIASLGVKLIQDEIRRTSNPREVNEILRDTRSSIDTAIDILGDLLTYEKLDSHMMELETTCCRIAAFIRRCLGPFRLQAASKSVELSIINPIQREGVEVQELEEVVVDIDESKIAQVLRNLMSNALKFTPQGGKVSVTIDLVDKMLLSKGTAASGWRPTGVTPIQDQKFVRVTIKDSGYGIEPENQHRLWKEMTQFHAKAQQQGGGTGLGLWITKRIVELHNGKVGFHSQGKGKGSEFYFELPVVQVPLEILMNAANEAEDMESSLQIKEESLLLRVLIVDDSSLNRKMTSRLLSQLGCEVFDADDGDTAVKFVREYTNNLGSLDVILMDNEMPRMNGKQAIHTIRNLGYRGLIIGVTGNGQSESVQDLKDSGANHVLIKPLRLKELKKVMTSVEES